MTLLQLVPAALASRRPATLKARAAHLAAWWWWALRTHVAERHGLPRGSAGPPPVWPSSDP